MQDERSTREDDVADLRDEVLAADDTGMIRQQEILTVTEPSDLDDVPGGVEIEREASR